MSTRCYLNWVSKSYEANRTLEGFVERPCELNFVTRHFFFALCRGRIESTECSIKCSFGEVRPPKKAWMPILAKLQISSCDSLDLMSFQVFWCNGLLATSLIRTFSALFYKTRRFSWLPIVANEIVFQRALTDAVVCLNSLMQVKIK